MRTISLVALVLLWAALTPVPTCADKGGFCPSISRQNGACLEPGMICGSLNEGLKGRCTTVDIGKNKQDCRCLGRH